MYVATYIIDIAALCYLIGLLFSSTTLNENRKIPFMIGILLTIIIIFCEAGKVYTSNEVLNLRSQNILCNVLGYSLAPMISMTIILIFDKRILKTNKLLLIPSLINIIATVLSPKFGFIFYIDENNQYFRGDCFFIFILVYMINLLILVATTVKLGKSNNYPIMWKMIALALFTFVGTGVQLFNPSAYSSWHCVTLALLLYFILMSEFDGSFDSLTGLYNRAAFNKITKQLGAKKSFSVIVIDINDFKMFNDKYGHAYGDTVIKTVATIVRKSFNKHYTCYRIGGDEFAIIGNETDKERIKKQLITMTDNLAGMSKKGNILPTVSYGYSVFQKGENHDFRKTFKEADEQMFSFKKTQKSIPDENTSEDNFIF